MRAYCLIREQPWYRRDAFVTGLRAAGHTVETRWPLDFTSETLLVIWNRYAEWAACADRVEAAGGKVIVAENGYLGTGGASPKFKVHPAGPTAEDFYALGLKYHNSCTGNMARAVPDRFDALGCVLKPWRASGGEVLILPNRSFGIPGRAMPPAWEATAAKRISRQTRLEVRIRPHPGTNAPRVPLAHDLANARCAVIWSSSAGIHALLEGIPVFVEGPDWVMYDARASGPYDNPSVVDREPHFHQMAYKQWTVREITSGEPFQRLLHATRSVSATA